MPYRITNLKVNGIRGFNKPEEINFAEGLTLLYGKNGSGKSSILQALEWGMTGKLPYMKGGDFGKEDAIVNMFTRSKKGVVEVNIEDGKGPISLQRTRKLGKTSSPGKSTLEMRIDTKTTLGDEAEEELEKLLEISMEAFPQSKYLHQETLREILLAGNEERSKAIDKLLGTYEVREFAKTIDLEKGIKSSASNIQDLINTLLRERVQFRLNLKRSLEETKKKLLSKGLSENDLTLAKTVQKLDEAKQTVDQLVSAYQSKPLLSITIKPDAQSLIEAHKYLLAQSNSIDRIRLEAINRINLRKTSLKTDSTKYGELNSQLELAMVKDPKQIQSQIDTIEDELTKTSSEVKSIRQKLTTLPHRREIYETSKAREVTEKEKLDKILQSHGTVEEIQEKIKKGQSDLKTIQNELDKLSGQQRLVTLAIDHLKATGAQTCPVCSQEIDNGKLVTELKTKVSDELSATSSRLNASENQIKAGKGILDEAMEEQRRLEKSIRSLQSVVNTAKDELNKLVPDFESLNLVDVAKEWEEEIKKISNQESNLRQQQAQLNDLLNRLTSLLTEVKSLETTLQNETSSKHIGSELVKKVEELVTSLDDESGKYSDSSEVDSLQKSLAELPDTLTYLRDEERLTEAEKELPQVEKQIEQLEARKSSLQALDASLQSIKQVAQQYQKDESTRQLKSLEDEINDYYSRIQRHPYFTQLKIEVEKEDPLTFSFRASSKQDDTYIPTRFSTAQFNAAALSIFMSNSTQQAGEMPLMIFDDPTQNMDNIHKESFAKLVSTLIPRFQVIIATEDEETRNLLEEHCKKMKTYELGEWNTEGPQINMS